MSDEQINDDAARRSNRRHLIALGIVILIFASPMLYALGRYLLTQI